MPRRRPPIATTIRALVGLAVLLALAVLATAAPGGAQPAPPSGAPEAPAGSPPVDATGEAVVPPAGAEASGLDRLAQLLTAPRPIKVPAEAAPEPEPPSGPPYKSGPAAESPVIIPPPALPPGDGTVYAVGDSVLLGTEDYLRTTVGGWDLRLDAEVGRRFPAGVDLVTTNRDRIGQAVVICLGHNYGGGGAVFGYLDELMAQLRTVPRVVFVTVAEWSPAQPEVNRAIRALPAFYPNVVVADWQAVSAANPAFLVGDRVHLSRSGNIALANLIAVMLGPASRDGSYVAPPRILDIPVESPSTPTTPTTGGPASSTSTTSTTAPASTTTTSSTVPDTTTTTAPPDTTTTVAPSTTTTLALAAPP